MKRPESEKRMMRTFSKVTDPSTIPQTDNDSSFEFPESQSFSTSKKELINHRKTSCKSVVRNVSNSLGPKENMHVVVKNLKTALVNENVEEISKLINM